MINIILPVDFSETTDILVQNAIKFAKDLQGKICMIHVAPADLGFAISDMGFQYFPEIERNEIREELTQLHHLENQIKTQGVDCEHILKQGSAQETIIGYAAEKDAAYIVMGSHGRSGLYDVFVGSLTKGLTKNSTIPVLVIPCHK